MNKNKVGQAFLPVPKIMKIAKSGTGRNACPTLMLFALLLCTSALAQTRETFDFGWRFTKGDNPDAAQAAFNDSGWRALALPHDWSIEGPYDQNAPTGGPGGYLPTGIGWYRKTFRLPESAKGKIITLQFDGVYMDSTVWINGHKLGTRPYGYIPFEYDLTPNLVFGGGDNVIAVRVDNSHQPNSRWYSGSGIYRHVWLRTRDPLHIPTWGVCVTTPQISADRAVVHARVNVRNANSAARTAKVSLAVLDASGAIVAQGVAGSASKIVAGGELEFSGDVTLPSPKLWSPDTPNLYRLRATVAADGRDCDVADTTFGVRTIAFDLNRGFLLNGKKLIMRGMCLHHDAGSVGAAVPDAVLRRRLLLLKEMGCNAIRTSHNPASPEFYDLCDELGLLVMSEFVDEWTKRKGQIKFGYSDYFNDWHERDLTAHIRQTRNHPCVVMWSAGNEIDEQTARDGDKVLRLLVTIFHREDPTRPVTAGLSKIFTDKGHIPAAFVDQLDVAGYNYVDRWGSRRETFYADDRVLFPRRKMVSTEESSPHSNRGYYSFGRLQVDLSGNRNKYASKNADKNAGKSPKAESNAPRGPTYPSDSLRAEELWKFIATHDYVEGYFTWTGIDYLGESEWPRTVAAPGALDTCGFKKDSFYFFQSIWTKKPMIHLLPHWNWAGREGQVTPVVAFTNANFAELFLNGRSLGVKAKEFPRQGAAGGWNVYARPYIIYSTTELHFTWDVPYEPGELRAVAYDGNGKIIAETRMRTAGPPAALELTVDRAAIAADARDVAHVTVRALDSKGVFVPLAKDKITFEISGPAKIIGVDNGNPTSHESYQGNTRTLYSGMALALVQSGTQAGAVKLTARAKGLKEASVEITTK